MTKQPQPRLPGMENIPVYKGEFPNNYQEAVKFLRKYTNTTIKPIEDATMIKVAIGVEDENADTGKYSRSYEVPALADPLLESSRFQETALIAAQHAHKFKELRETNEL